MSNKRSAFSWTLSLFIHGLLAVVVLRTTYRFAMPEGQVTADSITFEAVAPKGNQTEVPTTLKAEKTVVPEKKQKRAKAPKIVVHKSKHAPKTLPAKKVSTRPVQEDIESPAEKALAQVDELPQPPTPEETPTQDDLAQEEQPQPPQDLPQKDEGDSDQAAQEPPGLPDDNAPPEAGPPQKATNYGIPTGFMDETKLSEIQGNPKPRYPYMARLRRQQGSVIIRAYVKADGRVDLPIVEQSSGFSILDQEAVEAYSRWRYKPGPAGWVQKRFNFKLNN